jgi:L-threonylcarbamoyladenylate synthase
MTTEILATDTPQLFEQAVRRCAETLRAGGVVAVPTETVYGLAANAFDPHAVAQIYRIKERPANNPIIVHVAGLAMARSCVSQWPEQAEKLAATFWPGPLTLVLPRSHAVPDIVTAGGQTVAIRWPSHPFMQALIRACGFPLAAPSANLAARTSPTCSDHVLRQLAGKLPIVVDGGASDVGIESTVLDLATSPPRILRPGMVHAGALEAVIGPVGREPGNSGAGSALPSPGLLQRHYAPNARLVVRAWADDRDLFGQISDLKFQTSKACIIAHTRIPSAEPFRRVAVIPGDPEAFARALYAELHECDAQGAGLIVVEALPAAPEWNALADRLRKAAATKT